MTDTEVLEEIQAMIAELERRAREPEESGAGWSRVGDWRCLWWRRRLPTVHDHFAALGHPAGRAAFFWLVATGRVRKGRSGAWNAAKGRPRGWPRRCAPFPLPVDSTAEGPHNTRQASEARELQMSFRRTSEFTYQTARHARL